MAVILVVTDQKAQVTSNINSPTGAVLGVNAFANLMLVIGIGHGFLLLWWRRELFALDDRGTLPPAALHRTPLWHRYAFAAAASAFILKLFVADSVLLPEVSSNYLSPDPETFVPLTVPHTQTFPQTGAVRDGSNFVSSTTPAFQRYVLSPWLRSLGPYPDVAPYFTGCDGTCEATFEGIGFAYDCSINRTAADYQTQESHPEPLPVFSTSFTLGQAAEEGGFTIDFNSLYYQAEGSIGSCKGQILKYSCAMRPALFNIAFTVIGDNATEAPGVTAGSPLSNEVYYENAWNMYGNQTNGWDLIASLDDRTSQTAASEQLGGIQLALQQYLGSSANITYSPNEGWVLSQEGWYAADQLSSTAAAFGSEANVLESGGCNYNYGDPSLDIVQRINSLMLLLNTQPVASGGGSNAQTAVVSAQQNTIGPHFQTNYPAMYGVVATLIVSVMLVLPSYYGFWNASSRRVNLGTVELVNHHPDDSSTSDLHARPLRAQTESLSHDAGSVSTAVQGDDGSAAGNTHRRTTSTVATLR